ncbi:MAG TPA: YetF domain-containing protein [Longimicrobiaceae bacterium]|jgi:uncharacterized membrane protein YcaP (DUF421 family)
MLQEARGALEGLLGLGRDAGDIEAGQMALRAVVVYAFTLGVVRVGSRRFLGKATAFDVILGIMIGSVMSRGINGSAGLVPTLAAGAVLVALHGLFAMLAFRTSWFGDWVKGRPVLLVEDGRVRPEGMRQASLTENDLAEALRLQGREPDPSRIRRAYLERNGSVSVVPREGAPRVVEVAVADGVQTVRVELS